MTLETEVARLSRTGTIFVFAAVALAIAAGAELGLSLHNSWATWGLAVISTVSSLALVGLVRERREHDRRIVGFERQLEEAKRELRELATSDGLTGLKNRRAFREKLDDEFNRATRYGLPLSVVLLDLDHFKRFNDAFGQAGGDKVLNTLGRLLLEGARSTDVVARCGGDEFAIILTNTDAEGAKTAADRYREAIAAAPWELRAITASFGVTTLGNHESGAGLISAAATALHCAKRHGRNCVHQSDRFVPVAAG